MFIAENGNLMWFRSPPTGTWIELTNRVSKAGDTISGGLMIQSSANGRYVYFDGTDSVLLGGASTEPYSLRLFRSNIFFCQNRTGDYDTENAICFKTGDLYGSFHLFIEIRKNGIWRTMHSESPGGSFW